MFNFTLDFVELHNGPIPDHQFNESINGVFRQAKSYIKKSKDNEVKIVSSNAIDDGQLSIIDMIRRKKPAPNVTNQVTISEDDTSSNSSDSNDDGDQ